MKMPSGKPEGNAFAFILPLEVSFSLLGEDVSDVAAEGEVDEVAHSVAALHLKRRNDNDNVSALCRHMEVDGGAHHFGDVNLCNDAGIGDVSVLRTNAEGYRLALNAVLAESCFLLGRELDPVAAELDVVLAAVLDEVSIEEVHLGHSDEARDEEVCRMIEHVLRSADLLNEAVLHDNDAVAKGHGLGLIVGNVDEGGVDTLAELDDLGAHLVTELGVEVGKRLVHKEDGGVTDDSTADGNTLSLSAGEGLRLAVEILGDVEDLGSLADLLIYLILRHLLELKGEGHIFINGHMGVKRVVLEDHRDIAILGGDVVDESAVDIELALGDLFKAGDHTKGGGLSAAGGADENDEFLIGYVKVELLNGYNALIGDLKVYLLLLGSVTVLLLFLLLFAGNKGVDLLHVLKLYSRHTYRLCAF